MQQLLGEKAASTDSSFLRELFLQCMPDNICMVLASTADTVSLEELATLTDKVMDVAAPSIAAVSTPQSQISMDMEQLRAEVTRLKDVVTALSKSHQPRRSGRSPSPHPPTDSTLCWYHQRFGKDARKCRPPCPGRETTQLVASGDERSWPGFQVRCPFHCHNRSWISV